MALHDYRCPGCGFLHVDIYRSITVSARTTAPVCHCGHQTEWIPQVGRMEAGGGTGGFEPFETQVLQPDGSHKTVTVSTLNDIRRIERETERQQRNGEGQAMVWRDYSQDRNNTHVHTLGTDPSEAPSAAALAKFGPAITRHGETEPVAALGPGVTESMSSVFADV